MLYFLDLLTSDNVLQVRDYRYDYVVSAVTVAAVNLEMIVHIMISLSPPSPSSSSSISILHFLFQILCHKANSGLVFYAEKFRLSFSRALVEVRIRA